MAEEATHAGYPMDAAAILLIELEGLRETVEEQAEQVRQITLACGAREVRVARSAQERELLWKGRKNAFGAVGRVSPTFMVQDGVVPRTKIASTLRFIHQVSEKYGLTISNIFHAGDGNLHPLILFNARREGELEKARAAAAEILRYCIEAGGTLSGEHGVGMEKRELMPVMFSADTLEMTARVMSLFDPQGLFNPGKILPAALPTQ
jgi:glycolate oxidase